MTHVEFLIAQGENKYVEFKEKYTKTLLKSVCAFANYHTGTIIIGVSDRGGLVGLDDPEGTRLMIENAINDVLVPRPYYEINMVSVDGVMLVVLRVTKGEHTPYTCDRKAYMRRDTSTVEVDKMHYDELVLHGKNQAFEDLPYEGDQLPFSILENALKESVDLTGLDLNVLKSLELYRQDSYTNAAALFADVNRFKAIGLDLICYGDETLQVIKDRVHLEGVSIIKHYKEAIAFYHKHINRRDIIQTEKRISFEEVPLIAYREALANAVIHRNYQRNACNRIEFFSDRIEIVSIGGLPIGISEEEYLQGDFSTMRNRVIGDLFYRLAYVEKLGTGIRRIKRAYLNDENKPVFKVMENSIKVILPFVQPGKSSVRDQGATYLVNQLTPEEEKLHHFVKSGYGTSRVEIEDYMGVSKTKATNLVNRLIQVGCVRKAGQGKASRYYAK